MRLRYDALTYRWQTWVVGFDSKQQLQLLHGFFGEISGRVFATALLGSWALVLIPVAISLLRKRATCPGSPLDKHYRLFCERVARLGFSRKPGETPEQFALRVMAAQPHFSDQLWRITGLYNDLAYADVKSIDSSRAELLRKFTRAVASFRPDRRGERGEEVAGFQR